MQPETRFKIRFFKKLKENLVRVFAEKIQQRTKVGSSDIYGCVKCPRCRWGRFFAVELKRSEDEKPTKIQRYKLKRLKDAGAFSVVCSPENLAEIIGALRELELD